MTTTDGRPIQGGSAYPVAVLSQIAAVLEASSAFIGRVAGYTALASGSIARPNDTTAYAAGDVWTTPTTPSMVTLAGAARVAGGTGVILGGVCRDSANQSTKPNLDLYLFASTVTVDADNTPWTPTDAELAPGVSYLGLLQFTSWSVGDATSGAGGNCVSGTVPISPIAFACAPGSTDLYGIVVPRNAYTPVALEELAFALRVLQD